MFQVTGTLVFLCICATVLASPFLDSNYEGNDIKSESSQNEIDEINSKFVNTEETTDSTYDAVNGDSDDMETADMIIFRPMFLYRKRNAQRYRIKANNNNNYNNNRRYYSPYYY